MLKENCLKYTTNCSSNHPYAFIVRPLDTNNKDLRIMLMEITEEQENELDNNKSISIEKGSYKFNIEPDMCYAYGKLDLSPNSKDIENIYKLCKEKNIHLILLTNPIYVTTYIDSIQDGYLDFFRKVAQNCDFYNFSPSSSIILMNCVASIAGIIQLSPASFVTNASVS